VARVLVRRLDDQRRPERAEVLVAALAEDARRDRHAEPAQERVGERLLQAEREGERWRAGVADPGQLEEPGDARLQARVPAHRLDQVEDQLGPLGREQREERGGLTRGA